MRQMLLLRVADMFSNIDVAIRETEAKDFSAIRALKSGFV
jgi:hypothetical protein